VITVTALLCRWRTRNAHGQRAPSRCGLSRSAPRRVASDARQSLGGLGRVGPGLPDLRAAIGFAT
jgi:hypothetical protein